MENWLLLTFKVKAEIDLGKERDFIVIDMIVTMAAAFANIDESSSS